MSITLHGYPGVIVTLALVFAGIADLIVWAWSWAEDRFTRSGWHVRRRWDGPGAPVILPGGREGAIEEVHRDAEAGAIALVIFDGGPPEWVPLTSLDPAPAGSREVAA